MQPNGGFVFNDGLGNFASPQSQQQQQAQSRLYQWRQAPAASPGSSSYNSMMHANSSEFVSQNLLLQQRHQPFEEQFAQLSMNQGSIHQSVGGGSQYGQPLYGSSHHNQHLDSPVHQQEYDEEYENGNGSSYFYNSTEQYPNQHGLDDNQYVDLDAMPIPDEHIPVQTGGTFSYNSPHPLTVMNRFHAKGAAGNGQTQFISPDTKAELLARQLVLESKLDTDCFPDVPQQVEHLTNLVPLENVNLTNLSQTSYKASSIRDGINYCIRRIHAYRCLPGNQLQICETWKKLKCSNIVAMREIIPNCREFGDTSFIFSYDYYPMAETLKSKYFDNRTGTFLDTMTGMKFTSSTSPSLSLSGGGLPETQIWEYIIQISAALRVIHSNGLAARNIDLSKIIVYGKKILLSFCGVADVVNPELTKSIHQQQMEDLIAFGCVLIALTTGKPHGSRKDLLQSSMIHIQTNYSNDMRNVVQFLLTSVAANRRSINEIMAMIGARFYTYIENLQNKSDQYESELSKELQNGRLFRLLAMMNTVLERVEHNRDEKWSETGDRFMLKLFRDYVFHQVTDQGKPWLDMSHIVQCLNKLDSGSSEKIEMVSRNGDIQIIVDYMQLKKCLDKSFQELANSKTVTSSIDDCLKEIENSVVFQRMVNHFSSDPRFSPFPPLS